MATPLHYLVGIMTPTSKCSSISTSTKGYADDEFLERHFIGMSLIRTREILNNQDTKTYGQITAPRILSFHGKPPKAASGVKSVIGFRCETQTDVLLKPAEISADAAQTVATAPGGCLRRTLAHLSSHARASASLDSTPPDHCLSVDPRMPA